MHLICDSGYIAAISSTFFTTMVMIKTDRKRRTDEYIVKKSPFDPIREPVIAYPWLVRTSAHASFAVTETLLFCTWYIFLMRERDTLTMLCTLIGLHSPLQACITKMLLHFRRDKFKLHDSSRNKKEQNGVTSHFMLVWWRFWGSAAKTLSHVRLLEDGHCAS